jgi:ABC-2 type transport system permease protein
MEYRTSFALFAAGAFFATALDFVTIAVIFGHLPRLATWSLGQVAMLYGVAGVSFGITDLAIGSLDVLPTMIRTGSFDRLLVRPIGSLYQVVATEFSLRQVGKILQAAVVLAIAISLDQVRWDPLRVGVLAAAMVTGPLLFGSVWVIAMTHVFWTVDTGEVANAFTYGGQVFASYPVNMFGRWLRDLLGFVIPLAFVSYYPVLFILGKPDPLGLPSYMTFLSPVAAVFLVVVAVLVWRTGVRHYRGTGS